MRPTMSRIVGVSLFVAVCVRVALVPAASDSRSPIGDVVPVSRYSEFVDEAGVISFPSRYRAEFVHLGSFAVATKREGTTDELHGVYARASDIAAYRKDGSFPDGAIIVKEVYATSSAPLTTGNVTWATGPKVWFVMVKDAHGRFPGNDLWGDGWGWALFDGADPRTQVAKDYRSECRSCHVPARKDDWLYVRGYPLLAREQGADD